MSAGSGSGGGGGEASGPGHWGSYEIAELTPEGAAGRVGFAGCPGWREGRFHADQLGPDLDRIARWGATALICLIREDEIEGLGIDRLCFEVRRRGIGCLHLPIADKSVPDEAFEREWSRMSGRLMQALDSGSRVFAHCVEGLGRSGLFVAKLLIERGAAPDEAIAKVRATRSGAIETPEQEAYLQGLTPGARG